MYNILTLNKIASCGMNRLPADKFTYGDDIQNPDAIVLRSFSMHGMELPASLKAVARAGAGVNNIPIEQCTEKGIVVFNTPGANANAVMELVIASLLFSSRKIIDGIDWVKSQKGEGENLPKVIEKGKSAFAGPEVAGKRLGVIGLGAIGVLVCNAACGLGMEVMGYDPYISVDAAWGLSRMVKRASGLKEIYESCDYITLHLPQTEETKGMINEESISGMKDGVRIMNFSRGGLVDSDVIIKAVESGKVACYATDFPEARMVDVKNIICIPHLGASTPESEDNCAVMAAEELKEYLINGNIRNSVNFPSCSLERTTDVRICIMHKNIPNMLSQISSMVAGKNINISNMLNKSRNDNAYTILDVDEHPGSGITDALKAIEGVFAVRVID